MPSNNHDVMCGEYVDLLLALGCYDEEFVFWGFAYRENGVKKYYITGNAEKAYTLNEFYLENGIFVTPVEKYFKWCKVTSGQRERLKQSFKLDFAKKMQQQYSHVFFDVMERLYMTPANNTALEWMQNLKKQLRGTFDLDGLQLFYEILKMMYTIKKIRVMEYLSLKEWVEKEMSLCNRTNHFTKNITKFYGYVYQKPDDKLGYYVNAVSFLAFERINEMRKKGQVVYPVFTKEYQSGSLQEFHAVKQEYEEYLKLKCNQNYISFIESLWALPSAFEGSILKVENNAIKLMNPSEISAFEYYWQLWHIT